MKLKWEPRPLAFEYTGTSYQKSLVRNQPKQIPFDPVSSAIAVALSGLKEDLDPASLTPLDKLWSACYYQSNSLIHHLSLFVRGFNENKRQKTRIGSGEEAVAYLADVLGMRDDGTGTYYFVFEGFRHQVRQWRGWLFLASFEEKLG